MNLLKPTLSLLLVKKVYHNILGKLMNLVKLNLFQQIKISLSGLKKMELISTFSRNNR